jgi:hypothetical protein
LPLDFLPRTRGFAGFQFSNIRSGLLPLHGEKPIKTLHFPAVWRVPLCSDIKYDQDVVCFVTLYPTYQKFSQQCILAAAGAHFSVEVPLALPSHIGSAALGAEQMGIPKNLHSKINVAGLYPLHKGRFQPLFLLSLGTGPAWDNSRSPVKQAQIKILAKAVRRIHNGWETKILHSKVKRSSRGTALEAQESARVEGKIFMGAAMKRAFGPVRSGVD